MKGKGYVVKRCPDGESYKFVNGVCKVPGLWIGRKEVKLTLVEFNSLVKDLAGSVR